MVRVCGNCDDAEDALADAILAALKSSDQLRNQADFQSWLSTIGTRACIRSRVRKRLASTTSVNELESKGIEISDTHRNPEEEAEMRALKECLAGAVDQLPEIYHEVYLRREIDGVPAEDVAQALDISIPAVKSRLHRARTLVREAIDSGLGCDSLYSRSI